MGLTAATLGIGIPFKFEGKDYKLSPWTFDLQGIFERYLEMEATEAAKRMGELLSQDEYRTLLKDLVKDIGAGLYTFGGEEVHRSLQSPKHLTKMLHLMLQQDDPSVSFDLVKRMVSTDLPGIMEKIALANTDPTKDGKKS